MSVPRNVGSFEEMTRFAQKVRAGQLADQTTLTHTTAGVYKIKDGGVGTTQLADLSVTTNKLAANAVTVAKLLLATNPGLEDSTGLRVKVADTTLTRGASGMQVALTTNGGLEVSSGVKVKVDGSTVTINGSGALVAAGGVSTGGLRNRILNGDFRIAQRGTSIAAAAAATPYTLDRWQFQNGSAGAVTITQDADVPTGKHGFSLKMAVTTADAAVAAGDYAFITQKIEGYNIAAEGKASSTFSLSFWVKVSKGASLYCSLRNSTGDRSYLIPVQIAATNTWQQVTSTITMTTAGTWDYTTGIGLQISFAMMAGSTLINATNNAWVVGNFIAGSTTTVQGNHMDTIGNTVQIYGVQLEPGSTVTAFEPRPYGLELALCQRYFHKSYTDTTAPATATTVGENRYVAATAAGEAGPEIFYPVDMRAVPTLTIYSPATGASGNRRNYTAAADAAMTTVNAAGTRGHAGGAANTASSIYGYHYTASAEL